MKEELETLVTQVKALLTECLQGWLQALSQGDSVDDPASLGQLAVQLSTAYSTLQAAAAAYPGDTGGSAQAPRRTARSSTEASPRHPAHRASIAEESAHVDLGRIGKESGPAGATLAETPPHQRRTRAVETVPARPRQRRQQRSGRARATAGRTGDRERPAAFRRLHPPDPAERPAGSTQALRAQDSGEQAILEAVNAAGSLAELRPSHLQSGQASANQLVMSQIADRLANLVKSEVHLCFEQNFGSLKQQLENAIAIFNQSNHNTSAPPPDKPDPPAA